jgi:Carboxypeptidase regulatory-like domain
MSGKSWRARRCASAVLLAVAAPAAAAQIGGGALAGQVIDQAGAALPGATLTLTAVGTNLSRTTVAGEDGHYLFTALAPGLYRVRVELSGFRPLIRDGIRLAIGETVRLSLPMQLGAVTEAITVTADASLLRGETAGLGHVIDHRKIVDLPLNGRSFIALATLAPGGVVGGPVRRDRTFFFADYQGQRQTIGRTVISTVPTQLQRQGIFTEAIGGRVPAIYDPATTMPGPTGGVTRQPFSGNTIPADRVDPVARQLLERYPLPTSAGTANNYRRVNNETVDQHLVSVRLDHRLATGRDDVFGRLTRFDETFIPVTPLPEGSGLATGTLGPQQTTSWSFASS